MEIGPLSNRQAGQKPEGPEKPEPRTPSPEKPSKIVDRVEISEDARAKLGELADQELRKEQSVSRTADAEGLISADRMETIRRRIKSGYYDQAEVKAKIADKLIDDMDL